MQAKLSSQPVNFGAFSPVGKVDYLQVILNLLLYSAGRWQKTDIKNILLLVHNLTLTWSKGNLENIFTLHHNQKSVKNELIINDYP